MRAAAAAGAELVVLPEKWNLLGGAEELVAGAEELDSGPTIAAAGGWARELGIHLVAGSIAERAEGEERLFNTCCVFDPAGEIVAIYRKIHMFDVDVGGVRYRESDAEQPGEEIVATEARRASRLGLTICYDLRFPELYRILAVGGARSITVPAAFTQTTGRDHWEVLLRARAIENQAFVIAPEPVRRSAAALQLLRPVDDRRPLGAGPRPGARRRGFVIAPSSTSPVRRRSARRLPSLANRRRRSYRWPDPVEASA